MSAVIKPVLNAQTRVGIALAIALFVVSLVLYALTLAPTVTLVDSGELILAARSLGVAHPPGFPLYVMLAHLATLVPLGSIATRVNFASAVFAALASATMALTAFEAAKSAAVGVVLRKKGDRKNKKRPEIATDNTDSKRAWVLVAPALVAGLLFACSRTVWAYATIAEVYTLNALLILVVFVLMFRWRSERQRNRGAGDQPKGRAASASNWAGYRMLYAAAFFFGVALGVHHVTVALMLPALAALVFGTEGFGFFKSRRLLYAAAFSFAGLFLVYAYLPIAASRSPIMNWGDPRTLERLWWHVTGRQYQVFFSFSLATMANQLVDFIKLAAREFGPWWFPLALALSIAGFVALFQREKIMFWFLILVMAADLVYCLGYEIAEDKDAYYLPAFIAMSIAAGFGVQWLLKKLTIPRLNSRMRSLTEAVLIVIVPVVAFAGNLPYNNRHRYYIAKDYVDNVLSTVEPGGMLLTRDWQVYSPMLYTREIEHRRDDVVVIDINQLRRSWYFDYLTKAYPNTIEQARDKVDAFLEDLRNWEHDPDLYQRDAALNQRISARFYEMILAFISNHVRSAPVYATLDVAANSSGEDAELTKSLSSSYQFVPDGLVFRLSTSREFQPPAAPELITRGLNDGSLKFEDDDVVKVKVLPFYGMMFYNRGRYLAAAGHHEEAVDSFKRSLEMNPGFSPAQKALNDSLAAIRKSGGGRFP